MPGFLETLVSDITYWPILPKVPLTLFVSVTLEQKVILDS